MTVILARGSRGMERRKKQGTKNTKVGTKDTKVGTKDTNGKRIHFSNTEEMDWLKRTES